MAPTARPLGVVPAATSAVLGRMWRLPPKRNRVLLTRALRVPMRDGAVLIADHYAPAVGEACPTVLIRSPYGRGFEYGLLMAQLYAERGYHVLLQSTRGTFGSGGDFFPVVHEAADGRTRSPGCAARTGSTAGWARSGPVTWDSCSGHLPSSPRRN
jgi:predicted acyl esterase